MAKKSVVILRLLAGITGLEAVAGVYDMSLVKFGADASEISRQKYPHIGPVVLFMTGANLIFLTLLLVSAWLLWRLRRRGLLLLTLTLCAELLYFLGIAFGSRATSGPASWGAALAAATGVGNMGLSPQISTAYPLVAGVLIFLAYRYIGIPARERDAGI